MVVEILPPINIAQSEWDGFPATAEFDQWQNVDELMASIDVTDYNRHASDPRIIKHILGKVTNLGHVNQIKMAMNVKRFAAQGVAGLLLDVYLDGLAVVPQATINVNTFNPDYAAIQNVWLDSEFLSPWVDLTGQQWNDAIDGDISAAQMWLTTHSFEGAPPPPPPPFSDD